MSELTRNESADKLQRVWATILERAPESTKPLFDAEDLPGYLEIHYDFEGIHQDHFDWLIARLDNDLVLCEIDAFAEKVRSAGPAIEAPWRD